MGGHSAVRAFPWSMVDLKCLGISYVVWNFLISLINALANHYFEVKFNWFHQKISSFFYQIYPKLNFHNYIDQHYRSQLIWVHYLQYLESNHPIGSHQNSIPSHSNHHAHWSHSLPSQMHSINYSSTASAIKNTD